MYEYSPLYIDFIAMDVFIKLQDLFPALADREAARQLAVAAMVAAEKYEWIFKPGKYEEQQQCQS